MKAQRPEELEKALADYAEFTTVLRAYGHRIKTERVLAREKVVDITPGHEGKGRTADELIAHLRTVLNHARRAEEIRLDLKAVLLRQNSERQMAEWQLVNNLRLIRTGLIAKTREHIGDQIEKINGSLPRERKKFVYSIRKARETARLTGLLAAYNSFKREYEREKKKYKR